MAKFIEADQVRLTTDTDKTARSTDLVFRDLNEAKQLFEKNKVSIDSVGIVTYVYDWPSGAVYEVTFKNNRDKNVKFDIPETYLEPVE